MSLNVRGLRNDNKRNKIIKHYLYSHTLVRPHVVFMQETHSQPQDEKVWKVHFKYRLLFNHDGNDKGGLLIAVSQDIQFEIHNKVNKKDFMLIYCTINGDRYTLVNVHYQDSHKHGLQYLQSFYKNLWDNVTLFNCNRIIIGGDFNCYQTELDVLHSRTYNSSRVESNITNQFISETNLQDAWRIFNPTTKKYTCTQVHKSSMTRIDWFLVSPLILNYTYDTNIGIAFKTDHAPIYISIETNRNPKGPGIFRFPNHLTKDPNFRTHLKTNLDNVIKYNFTDVSISDRPNPIELMDLIIGSTKHCTIEYLQSKRKDFSYLHELQQQINDLDTLTQYFLELDNDPTELFQEMDERSEKLLSATRTFTSTSSEFNKQRARSFNNVCSKYFFQKVRGMSGAIKYLFNENDELVETDYEIIETCTEFYSNLYKRKGPESFRFSNFECPPQDCVLDASHVQILQQPITLAELTATLKTMKSEKSPGTDGLTVEFYKEYWDLLGPRVFDCITYAIGNGSFSLFQREGIMKLLPKPRKDPRFVRHNRPISLLNVIYKLFTKVLALRMKEILPDVVHTDQNGFITNRFIGSNVLDVYSLITLAEEAEQSENCMLLSLDIYKAFDSVNWNYLRTLLHNYGFPDVFLQWMDVMQSNAYIRVFNNGYAGPYIPLQKGLAQGCSVSPYLFIFAIEM